MKNTYEPEIVMKIWDVFPDSFNTTKRSPITDRYNGQYGAEDAIVGEETVVLAECIAATATAISHDGSDMDRALKYIESYKPAWIQKREIRNFLNR